MKTNEQTNLKTAKGRRVLLTDLLGRLKKWWKENPNRVNALILTIAFIITLLGAIFTHGNWLATLFAFTAAWFSWGIVK